MLISSVFRGFFFSGYCALLRISRSCGGLLLRFWLHFFEVLLGHLQIVLLSHLWAVDPYATACC